jgi:hypothetical protein
MDDIGLKKIWSKTDKRAAKSFDSSHVNKIIDRGSMGIINKFIKSL